MASVVLQDVTKIFSGPTGESICAVKNASLTVPDKRLLVLVGPSGCGKTTLLRLIAGLEEPTAGTISLDGQVINRVPAKDRGVAMVFQEPALYPHMSVYENLAFSLKLRKCPAAEIRRRVRGAAEMLDLVACLERKPQTLSGGQRQRVALGRALVRQPRVFLLDEPLSNLDAILRLQLRAELARLQSELGVTMLYVTHDQTEAAQLGHQIAVMNRGAIQQVADPMTLYRNPANMDVAGLMGAPPMNILHGQIAQVGDALYFQERAPDSTRLARRIAFRLDPELAAPFRPFIGREVVLGLRAEHIFCVDASSAPADTVAAAGEPVVELVEPLGWETLVYLATAAHRLAVRVPPAQAIQIHQRVSIRLKARAAHWFDPVTGLTIASAANS